MNMKTPMKITFAKLLIYQRIIKKLDKSVFQCDFKNSRKVADLASYAYFKEIFENDLDRHAPKKKKTLRANHKQYFSKAMKKSIMKQSDKKSITLYHHP